MSRSMKGVTPLLVIFAAVIVIGMLFFSKQHIAEGFKKVRGRGKKQLGKKQWAKKRPVYDEDDEDDYY